MKAKFYPKEELKKNLLDIIAKYLAGKKYQVFFFGSRIKDKVDERADIDVGIEAERAISLEVMAKIREKIEDLPTLYSIDVVDFKQVSKDFKKVAGEHIEIIHS